jgi:transcriptional regulator with XRE-family HTH domain
MASKKKEQDSLLEHLGRLTGQVAGGTVELARSAAAMTAMFGENWLSRTVLNQLEPERLDAMAEAGHFLRDARETAGLSIQDLSESLGLRDRSVLEKIESGESIMPLEPMLRGASLLARHDPIPFVLKFMRTYNPALEKTMEQWGITAIPREYERERRFLNLYRQHDVLRELSDDEFDRFIHYMEGSGRLVLEVMQSEKEANAPKRPSGPRKASARSAAGTKSSARKSKRKAGSAGRRRTRSA